MVSCRARCRRRRYISDVSEVPPATMEWLLTLDVEVLVADCCHWSTPTYSHMALPQALVLARALKARRVYLTGISCVFSHLADNATLRRDHSTATMEVQLAQDGQVIDMEL